MKFYSVPFAAMAVVFLGSHHVYGSTPDTADVDANAEHRSLPVLTKSKSNKECLDRCAEKFAKCEKECPAGPTPTIQTHSSGDFRINRWIGSKKVGSSCHPGCEHHSHVARSNNSRRSACGHNLANSERWVRPNDKKDCRIRIPYERKTAPARCEWEIREICS